MDTDTASVIARQRLAAKMYRPPFPRRLALNIEINVSQNTSADNQGQPEVNPEFEGDERLAGLCGSNLC